MLYTFRMDNPELADAFKNALIELANREGVEAALQSAALTLSYYYNSQPAGFSRNSGPVLFAPDRSTND
ncbi:hypothetical protein [Ochrobactrum soli]|uniref:Uncharacterized protein n=1 Tax=Ochrobactrum soli TaxID=2448455 RepID=A0A849KT76_9HYPH|nr:hypothetical protein [[Ochrobactrum] soli]NNU62967.1 hypothetical protein [[Ochrobactrum] soli]